MNLLQVKHVLAQKSPTSLLASPRSDRLQPLAGLEFPMATPSFVPHSFFRFVHVRRNFLQLRFSSIAEGNSSLQPEQRKGYLSRPYR